MDAEIVTRGSRIPKICALCVFILAVFFYAGLCSGDFFKGADFVRADPLEGVADLPGAVRALSFALVPPLFSFAAIFALSFTPYSFRYMLSAKTLRAGSSFHTRECFCVCRVCAHSYTPPPRLYRIFCADIKIRLFGLRRGGAEKGIIKNEQIQQGRF